MDPLSPTPRSVSRARGATLLEHLADPSATVWADTRLELEGLGRAALPILRKACASADARTRARARRERLRAQRARAARRLAALALRPHIDLERGLWCLARLEDPELDARRYLSALDALGAEVARRVERKPPGAQRAVVLADVLGRELGFDGDREHYHHADNVFLHRALERKRGLPLTLSALYLFVARRAGLNGALVALPGHVVLRLAGCDRHVLIDPFQNGAVITERDCLAYLAQHKLAFRSNWFADADEGDMLERQVRNLARSWSGRGMSGERRALEPVLQAFEARRAARAGARNRR